MRKHRLQALKFILASSILLFLAHIWQYQLDAQLVKQVQLKQDLDTLHELYTGTVDELEEVSEKNRSLSQQLQDALTRINHIEKRNSQLEQILFNQQQTYRAAVKMQGSTMPVLTRSDFTAKMYERAWSRLGAIGLAGTGEAFVAAEENYGVNSLVLAAIGYLESGGGMSAIARKKNNLFGLGAWDADPLRYAMTFSHKADSIYYVAGLLRNSYLSRGGRFYRGDNLQAIGPRYASDPRWAEKVGKTMAIIARAAIPEGR